MPEIKTREVVKGTIKALDRSAVAGERMKNAYIKTREKAERSVYSSENSPEEYASDRIGDTASAVVQETVYYGGRQMQRFIRGREDKPAASHSNTQQENPTQAPGGQGQSSHRAGSQPTAKTAHGSRREIPNSYSSQYRPQTAHYPRQNPSGGGLPSIRRNVHLSAQPTSYSSPKPQSKILRQRQVEAAKKAFQKQRQEQMVIRSHSYEEAAIPRTINDPAPTAKRAPRHAASRDIKTVQRTTGTIRQKPISPVTVSARATNRTIKAAEHTIKTAEQTQEVARQAAMKSAKSAAMATQKAVAAAKAARATARAAAAATARAVKAILAKLEELIVFLETSGSMAFSVVFIIMMVGILACSCFGILFSGQTDGSEIPKVIQEINLSYQQKLNEIKASVPHDELEMSGTRAVWTDVLAVYAVKTTTDPDNPLEVVTMDDEKKELLEEIFWEMHEITYEAETRMEEEIIETDDGKGNIVETPTEVEKVYLLIKVEHKTPEEMADEYHFDRDQREQLEQLLDEEFKDLWMSVLYGINAGSNDLVAVALSQVGNMGGEPYWSWYGFTSRVEWCACFVSWCANECGYIDAGVIPKFAGTEFGVLWFKERGQWLDNSAEPIPGMIIFYDWEDEEGGSLDGRADHVGIVERVEDGMVYTVEGNSMDACQQKSHPLGHYEILGYGVPAY